MANNPQFYDATVKTGVDAMTTLLNGGGVLQVYTGGQPSNNGALTGTLLVTLTFSSTAFSASSASANIVTATANSITSGTAGNTGTAGYFALLKSDLSTVFATGSVGTSGADANFSTLSIVSGSVVACSSFTITQSQL